MTTLRRYQNKVEEFLHSDNGQRFFNIAYSVGAAIVIWGALFKILHLPGGNTLLCVGMGTEIAMFILTAFDRPPKEPNWEEIVPALKGQGGGVSGVIGGGEMPEGVENLTIVDDTACKGGGTSVGGVIVAGNVQGGGVAGGVPGGGTVIVGGGPLMAGGVPMQSGDVAIATEEVSHATEELTKAGDLAEATNRFVDAIEGISKQMKDLHETLSTGSNNYAEHLADLNRNLIGLNTIYEIQLKSMSGQLDAIDKVNKGLRDIRDMYEKSAQDSAKFSEESERMTQYLQQINAVYARMIAALTPQIPTPQP